jgi:hypothetical protein
MAEDHYARKRTLAFAIYRDRKLCILVIDRELRVATKT